MARKRRPLSGRRDVLHTGLVEKNNQLAVTTLAISTWCGYMWKINRCSHSNFILFFKIQIENLVDCLRYDLLFSEDADVGVSLVLSNNNSMGFFPWILG